MTVETQPFENVPACGDFPACHVSFQGGSQIDPWNILALLGLSNLGVWSPIYGVTKPKASFQTLTQVHSMGMVDHLPTATSLKLPIFLKFHHLPRYPGP